MCAVPAVVGRGQGLEDRGGVTFCNVATVFTGAVLGIITGKRALTLLEDQSWSAGVALHKAGSPVHACARTYPAVAMAPSASSNLGGLAAACPTRCGIGSFPAASCSRPRTRAASSPAHSTPTSLAASCRAACQRMCECRPGPGAGAWSKKGMGF